MKRKSALAMFLVVVLATSLFPTVSAAPVGSSSPRLNRDGPEPPWVSRAGIYRTFL